MEETSTSNETGINLTKFRTSDGPIFKGPYQDVEAFLLWFTTLKLFYRTKGVLLDSNKITLTGNFIAEPPVQTFYEGSYDDLIKGTWDEFITLLFDAALPPKWEDKLYKKIQHIRMSPFEDFKTYSCQARSVQTLINYHAVRLSNHQLAKYVKYGMIKELKATVQLWDLSNDPPNFKYHMYEHRCDKIYASMVASKHIIRKTWTNAGPSIANTPRNQNQTTPRLSDEEFVWKIHSYLDSVGKCHFCKGYCGSAYRECKGPYVKEKVVFPPGYITPPKPSGYVPPRARSSPPSTQASAGQSTQAPAGRPPPRCEGLSCHQVPGTRTGRGCRPARSR